MRVFMPPCTVAVLVVAAALPSLSCANDKYGVRTTHWDDAEPGQSVEANKPADANKPGDPGEKKSVVEVAAGKRDAASCMENAERVGGDAGAALVRECMGRGDFYDLKRAVREPWLPKMRTSTQLQTRIVEVIARRGGFLEADMPVLARAKLPIATLEASILSPKPGNLVLARGTVHEVRSEPWGKGKGMVAEVHETSWMDPEGTDVDGTPTIADVEAGAPQKTGRAFFVRLEKKDQLRRAAEVVVLMTLEGPRTAKDDEGEEIPSIIGIHVAGFDASPRLRE